MEPLDPELRRIIREGLAEATPAAEVEARVLAGLLAKLPPEGPGGDGGASGPGGEVVAAAKVAGGVKALVIGGALAALVVAAAAATRGGGPAVEREGRPGHVVRDRSEERAREVPVTTATVVEEARRGGAEAEVRSGRGGQTDRGKGDARVGRGQERGEVVRGGASDGSRGEVGADALLAESRGVAEAEEALGRGDFVGALARVRALAASHPAGQLGLERAAVEICARCGLGEAGAAEAARGFLKLHADAAVAGKVRARCAAALGGAP